MDQFIEWFLDDCWRNGVIMYSYSGMAYCSVPGVRGMLAITGMILGGGLLLVVIAYLHDLVVSSMPD